MLLSTDAVEEQELFSKAVITRSDRKKEKKTKAPKFTTDERSPESICLNRKPIRPTCMRFIVIGIMSTTFLIQTFSQSIWSAIYEPALLAFPNWTSRSLSLLPIWGNVMSAVLVLPVCVMVDKYGLKVILSCSCCFFTMGTAVRCMPSMYSCTLCLHLSAVFLSVGGVVMTPLIVTMSAQWFPKNERNMATGFCSAISMLGSAATYIIGPMMVSAASDTPRPSPFVTRIQIMHMMYTCMGLNVFVTILVYLLFPRRIVPPTHKSVPPTESRQRACKLFRSIKTLVVNLNMWCLVFALTLSTSMSVPWSALIPSTFSRLRVSPKITTQCCFFMIIHTFGLSLSISSFAHRTPRYTKVLIMCSRSVSSIFLLWLMLMMDFHVELTTTRLYCVVLVAFPYSFCSQSLLYEMGAEQMCSLPESFVAGYMTVLNNLFVDFTYVVLYLFPDFDKYWLNIGIFVFSALSILFLYLSKIVTGESKKCDQRIFINPSDLLALFKASTTCSTPVQKKQIRPPITVIHSW